MAQNINKPSDIVGNLSNNDNNKQNQNVSQESINITVDSNGQDIDLLKSIDQTVKEILKSGPTWSQSDAHNMMPGRRFRDAYQASQDGRRNDSDPFGRRKRNSFSMDSFEDGLKEALLEGLLGSDFKEGVKSSLSDFAHSLGLEIEDIPNEIGKQIGKEMIDVFKDTNLGKHVVSKFDDIKNKAMNSMMDTLTSALGDVKPNAKRPDVNVSSSSASSDSASSDSISPDDFSAVNEDLVVALNQVTDKLIDALPHAKEGIDKLTERPDANDALTKGKDASDSMSNFNVHSKSSAEKVGQGFTESQEAASNLGQAMSNASKSLDGVDDVVNIATKALSNAGGAMSALTKAALPVAGAFLVITAALHILGPAIEGTKKLFEAASKSATRYSDSRKKNLEEAQKRIIADTETIIREPFEILKDAANELYQVWDNQLRTITATQGYNKSDLQDLMGVYADRLRQEGMTNVVSTADVTSNLAKVLESGLSGTVAEEFAYLATKLNAAVPTQDFFNYAETYASLAANAIKQGKSEAEAISYANTQLEQFASNVLYASRQISGGFSTGLRDAQNLFESSAKIATAAKTDNASEISGVLTSIAAVVGSIAPDLSSSIVESVVNAATGGNSSDIVALRSLAGINASNTEFLNALASDPKSVFSALFSNLAELQNMSNDNFMEVAEGLSEIFGISMDAFSRVDFEYLANAISTMNVTNTSLDENIKLLASGQTTTNAEQLRMAQINEYMLEEGLAYVLDNEAARAIQEHMWDEQLNRELMEAKYSVELEGAGLEFLEGISQTIRKIITILNFTAPIKAVTNLAAIEAEFAAQRDDLQQILELGKVGQGNSKDLSNLTTTNVDLKLASPYVELLGGVSNYDAISNANQQFYDTATITGLIKGVADDLVESNEQSSDATVTAIKSVATRYNWTMVGKSVADAITSTQPTVIPTNSLQVSSEATTSDIADASSTSAVALAKANEKFQNFVDSMSTSVKEGKSYSQWKATATKFEIADFDKALDNYGHDEKDLENLFESYEAVQTAEYQKALNESQSEFQEAGINFWTIVHPQFQTDLKTLEDTQITNQDTQITLATNTYELLDKLLKKQINHQETQIDILKNTTNLWLEKLFNKQSEFYDSWVDYYINHTAYNKATLNASDVADVKNAEKDEYGDAVLALANALTSNQVDLKDPVVQTNVLLSKILLVAEAIMQQNNQSSGLGLPNALAALGLGITTSTE